METQTDSKTPRKIYAGKLCIAASICLIIGISSFLLSLLLHYFMEQYYPKFTDVCVLGILLSYAMYFLAPLLGIIAIKDILSNWWPVTNPEDGSKSKGLSRKIAYSFLIAGVLFAAASLVPVIFTIYSGNVRLRHFPAFLNIWLMMMALLSLTMSCISYKLFKQTFVTIRSRIGAIVGIVVCFVAVAAVFLSTSSGYYLIQRIQYSQIPEIPPVDSSSLEQTVIIPTLDSPRPKNKNVIWCSSFQLAWNRMKDDVIGEPIEVVGAEETAARLNSAKQTAEDLKSYSVYAAAGRVSQGIIDRIQQDMALKFPSHPVPDFNDLDVYSHSLFAYSYLIANVPFKYPYRQVKKEFIFTDSNGVKTNVGAFGVWGFGSQYEKMRKQVEILYYQQDEDYQMKEFAVDLCRYSNPYQVVVAIVEPKGSLAQTLDYVRYKIADFQKDSDYKKKNMVGNVEVLRLPEMFWQIDHRFHELIGKIVANAKPPMPMLEATQCIKFKLGRYGAVLESEAVIFAGSDNLMNFVFNRPFLVYMKKRDCDQPFFVMWVDNAELLNKK